MDLVETSFFLKQMVIPYLSEEDLDEQDWFNLGEAFFLLIPLIHRRLDSSSVTSGALKHLQWFVKRFRLTNQYIRDNNDVAFRSELWEWSSGDGSMVDRTFSLD
jgi:hypothetical protein